MIRFACLQFLILRFVSLIAKSRKMSVLKVRCKTIAGLIAGLMDDLQVELMSSLTQPKNLLLTQFQSRFKAHQWWLGLSWIRGFLTGQKSLFAVPVNSKRIEFCHYLVAQLVRLRCR